VLRLLLDWQFSLVGLASLTLFFVALHFAVQPPRNCKHCNKVSLDLFILIFNRPNSLGRTASRIMAYEAFYLCSGLLQLVTFIVEPDGYHRFRFSWLVTVSPNVASIPGHCSYGVKIIKYIWLVSRY